MALNLTHLAVPLPSCEYFYAFPPRRYRLRVRTRPSQGRNPGSNPGIATNSNHNTVPGALIPCLTSFEKHGPSACSCRPDSGLRIDPLPAFPYDTQSRRRWDGKIYPDDPTYFSAYQNSENHGQRM